MTQDINVKTNTANQGESFCSYGTSWCPGCGNFAIQATLKQALEELGLDPHDVLLAAGIGQAAKMPQYLSANRFCGLHGRSLPAATAAKMANKDLTVVINTGDGDSFGEGGNHFLAAIRRNVNVTHFAHDNQVYGLTKGQASPTALPGYTTSVQTAGVINIPFNPLATALTVGAGFVARCFSGDQAQLKEVMKAAIQYDGYALVDIFQPCVSFNKVNTFAWYKERVRPVEDSHDVTDWDAAMKLAMTFGDDGIPTGILYNVPKPTFHSQHHALKEGEALYKRRPERSMLEQAMQRFA